MIKPVCWFVKITGWLGYRLMMRPKYHYMDKSRQSRFFKGKAIVMPIHYSHWDVAAMLHAFPTRNLQCIAAEVMYSAGFMEHFLPALGFVRVDRQNADFGFITEAGKILSRGGVVEIYPEARLPGPGEQSPLEFKPSVAYIALENDAPVIPVVHNGAYFRKERMQVLIGVPISVSELYDDSLSEKKNIENITEILRETIVEMKYELEKRTNKKEA